MCADSRRNLRPGRPTGIPRFRTLILAETPLKKVGHGEAEKRGAPKSSATPHPTQVATGIRKSEFPCCPAFSGKTANPPVGPKSTDLRPYLPQNLGPGWMTPPQDLGPKSVDFCANYRIPLLAETTFKTGDGNVEKCGIAKLYAPSPIRIVAEIPKPEFPDFLIFL